MEGQPFDLAPLADSTRMSLNLVWKPALLKPLVFCLLQEARACEAELKQKAAASLNLKLPTLLKGSPKAAMDASELQLSPFLRYNPPSPVHSPGPVSPPYSPHSPGWRTRCALLGHPLLAHCAAAQRQSVLSACSAEGIASCICWPGCCQHPLVNAIALQGGRARLPAGQSSCAHRPARSC